MGERVRHRRKCVRVFERWRAWRSRDAADAHGDVEGFVEGRREERTLRTSVAGFDRGHRVQPFSAEVINTGADDEDRSTRKEKPSTIARATAGRRVVIATVVPSKGVEQ